MNLQELKRKTPAELLAFAEELEIENASSLRKQDMLFAILKQLAENDVPISGDGVLEVLSDGFGFLRSPETCGQRVSDSLGFGNDFALRCRFRRGLGLGFQGRGLGLPLALSRRLEGLRGLGGGCAGHSLVSGPRIAVDSVRLDFPCAADDST